MLVTRSLTAVSLLKDLQGAAVGKVHVLHHLILIILLLVFLGYEYIMVMVGMLVKLQYLEQTKKEQLE